MAATESGRGPVMLVVLDGFGLGDGGPADSTALAHAPFFARARREFPMAKLETSGEAVGLPPGQMGNSEVGHMTLGAGRIIDMDMTRISKALANGGAARVPEIAGAVAAARAGRGRIHLLGLVSDGGVHSHQDHLEALIAYCAAQRVQPIVHAFLDGRDTPPRSGADSVARLLPHVERAGGEIATVIGRYWAMDRDNRWERIQRAYDAIVLGEGAPAETALAAVEDAYRQGQNDEFVEPRVIAGGAPLADGDVALFFNFRADRARELTCALASVREERFAGKLTRERVPKLARFVCMSEYDAAFGLPIAFTSEQPRQILAELLAARGLSQLRIAETEKYAHVTFFFNCGLEEPFPGEDRVLVPSPRDVPTYDHKPEMSAQLVTEKLLAGIADEDYAFILVNFANPDMVGHTGILPAAVKAVETIDACLDKVVSALLARGGDALITADHGNCELMVDPETGQPHTAHTTNPVPIWWVTRDARGRRLADGGLADVAPTLCALLGIPQPTEMTGHNLIVSR
ncbi:MAG TPA: 2,3-bisphosphoglycerate-independent phosphoglycerate mutase [Myxococcota bacterium]|nr:2,3-bisphosphoglycerate-independent phosphoglycerate mutase [Myxococcota bacterium]